MTTRAGKTTKHFQSIQNYFTVLGKNKSFKFGLPFLLFVLGGSFGLREWTQIRYEAPKVKGISREEAAKMGLNKPKKVTLESAYEEIKDLDLDNWENKRGPRPWEMSKNTIQK